MSQLTLALIQYSATADRTANLVVLERLIKQAAEQGAELILTPENADRMVATRAALMADCHSEADHPTIYAASGWARDLNIHLLLGSLPVIGPETDRLRARSLLIGPDGQVTARYDKRHMFDVNLPGGEIYRESERLAAGDQLVVAATPWGGLGLSICYDIRFPEPYRQMARAGAKMIAIPAAFTAETGAAHWQVLLRARAIETGAFVLAPAQTGVHDGGRRTHGHSLIISPWGDVIADGGKAEGVVMATIDLSAVDRARVAIPAWSHD